MHDCPIIVTACFDEATQLWLDDMRQRYFPAGRTVIGAHLTMFHAIAPAKRAVVHDVVQDICTHQPSFAVDLTNLRNLGRGVAIAITSAPLQSLRKAIAAPLLTSLTPQDAQGFSPHVTLANKMHPHDAKELLDLLRSDWTARQGRIEAIAVWFYLGPQWRLDEKFYLPAA